MRPGNPSAAGKTAPGRPYAAHSAELTSPAAARRTPTGDGLGWLLIAALGVGAWLIETRVHPVLRHLLEVPAPMRAWLLPPSPRPVWTVDGVGVGWFWMLFVAAPALSAVTGAAWSSLLAWSNYRARTGHLAQLRAGQAWVGHRYPAGPLLLAGATVDLVVNGMLLRWADSAARTLAGQLLLAALLGAGLYGWWQLCTWARGHAHIARMITKVTVLVSPALGWPDLRSGRVSATRCQIPRHGTPFPVTVVLRYAQHPRDVSDDTLREVAAALHEVTGVPYTLDHNAWTRTLVATHRIEVAEHDTELDAAAVLAPLVASWFDAAAHIAAITTDTDHRGDTSEDDSRSAITANDALAERIRDFTIGFAYTLKVSTQYRRGMIEAMVGDSLGGSWEAEWSMASQRVRFIRTPGLPSKIDPPLNFPTVTRARIRALYATTSIPFGVDAYGNVIGWDFTASPHLLICGQTASGKTSALTTISTQCTRRGFNVVWIDPKAFDSPGMRDWPNVSLVTSGTDDDGLVGHTAALRFIADTMRERLSQVKVNPNRADDFDPIIVITDEFSNLVVALAEFYKSFNAKGVPPTTKDVGILLRTARAVAIHMAIGIQRPDTMFIGGEARDNTAMRVAMGRLRSKDAAIMMFNDPVAGTRVQPGIKGRGTVQLPDGRFREIQAFYTPKIPATDQQWAALTDGERTILHELRNVDRFWPRRVIDSALRGHDPTKPPMTFEQIRQSPIALAAERPDLDPVSEQYVPPAAASAPTMDDHHDIEAPCHDEAAESPTTAPAVEFAAAVDGFDDDYLPDLDDEYGPPTAVAAHDITHGDLVDVSIDGVSDWKYVHAQPYPTDDVAGHDRLVIPYRDLENSQISADLDIDPYEVMDVRKLRMQ